MRPGPRRSLLAALSIAIAAPAVRHVYAADDASAATRLAQTDRSRIPLGPTTADPNATSSSGPTGGTATPAPAPGTAGTSGLTPGTTGVTGSVTAPATTDSVTGGTTGTIDGGAGASMIDCNPAPGNTGNATTRRCPSGAGTAGSRGGGTPGSGAAPPGSERR